MSAVDLSALGVRIDALGQNLQTRKNHTCENFPHDAEKGNATVIIAVTAIGLVLLQCHNLGISHVLGCFALSSTKTERFME